MEGGLRRGSTVLRAVVREGRDCSREGRWSMEDFNEHHKRWLRIANTIDGLRVKVTEAGQHEKQVLRHERMNALEAQLAAFEVSMRRVFKPKDPPASP